MVNDKMKDIVIISIYDSGYGFSVMVDGIVSSPYIFHGEKETVADILYHIYNKFGSESGKEFKKMFPNKQVILCEDGDIEIL